jgi:CIC family chloride channel protein
VLFIRGLYGTEDLLGRLLPGRPYLEHMSGMFVVGLIIAGVFAWRDQYDVQGVGYATIVDLLRSPEALWFVLLLFGLKLLATVMTLGSGASGGVFSPSLFMGAALGSAFASLMPGGIGENTTVFVLAGMAGMVAGTTGAVLTATVMLFEMTLDYPVVLPMLLAASVSYGVRRLILADSIYTMKLTRRGHVMPGALQANAHLVHHVADISPEAVTVIDGAADPAALDLADPSGASEHLVVVAGTEVVGVLSREHLRCHPAEVAGARSVAALVHPDHVPDHVVVEATATVFDLLVLIQNTHASIAVVVDDGTRPDGGRAGVHPNVRGVVTKAHLADAIAEGMELFED